MRHVAAAALVVVVLGGCGGGDGGSSPPLDPGPFVPLGTPTETGRFRPVLLAVRWFDGDAYPDVALTDEVHPEVRILLGSSDGHFTLLAPHAFGIPDDPSGIVAGFFDFDAFADLVVIGRGGGHNVLLGNGDGTFTALTAGLGGIVSGVPASSLIAADFNGDFFTDVAFGTPDGRVGAVAGTAGGSFMNLGVFMLVSMSPVISVAVADIDFDGDLDIVALQDDTTLSVLAQMGGGFTPIGVPLMIGGTPRSVVGGRFDLSSGEDIAVLDGAGAQVRFFSGGLAPFSPAFATVPLGEAGGTMALEPRPLDLRDGVVVTTVATDQGSLLRVAYDELTDLWGVAPIQGAPQLPVSVAFADMNLDTAPDLLVGSFDLEPPLFQGFLQTFLGSGQ